MRSRLLSILLATIVATAALTAGNHNTYPLPEERGTAGILGALQKLPVHVRVLYTTAHPDDESAATLTWLARKAQARTALYSLTRGDGGQNILGDEKYEAMGLVRTGELLEACRIYGVELYFSTAFEFGFSKTAEETFTKWGHEATLEEMVRFIRTWRPAIIISNFRNDGSGGHGHHQAAGIITHEAFRAAGDPRAFPAQGLPPWQARKLYSRSFGRGTGSGGSVAVPVGDYDPILGRSYREIGAEGYSKHRSQGNGAGSALPGQGSDYYSLVDSTTPKSDREASFFDAIDTSLPAILELAGDQRGALAPVEADLKAAQKAAEEALRVFRPAHPAGSAVEAAKGVESLTSAIRRVNESVISQRLKQLLENALEEKKRDFRDAVNAALGIYLVARADEPTVIAGQKVSVSFTLFNRGTEAIDLQRLNVLTPQEGWKVETSGYRYGILSGGAASSASIGVMLSQDARATEPFWYRATQSDNRYNTRSTQNIFAPFDPPEVSIDIAYAFSGTRISIAAPVMAQAGDPIRGSDFAHLQVVPTLTVSLKPEVALIPVSPTPQGREFHVSIQSNQKEGAQGTVRLIVPAGWKSEPAEQPFTISRKGESATARFSLQIPPASPGSFSVEAVASMSGKEYRRGYRVVSYPENWTRNLYAPSKSDIKAVDVKIAPRLSIGYVGGAGDEVPEALEQLGVKVHMLTGDELAFADLGGYSVIVTGIRAYNVNESLRMNNRRLLDYVERGGTLIVQYARPLGRGGAGGAAFPYGPYPMVNSDEDRITVEESPLEILDPTHPVFNTPNRITKADFDGWVQERGLYFMRQWDDRYAPLLSGHDPGEEAKKGGMLITRYGKGWYIYTAYAWFRQLPAGVPGAFRLFANMLSLGK